MSSETVFPQYPLSLGRGPLTLVYQAIRLPRAALIVLSFLLIGADLLQIRVSGFALKIVILPLFGALMFDLLRTGGGMYLDRRLVLLSGFLTLAACLSLPGSVESAWTLGYTGWLVFTFAVIVPVFYNVARSQPIEETLSLWMWMYRLQAFLIFGEVALRLVFGGISDLRPHLWFYEPSYAAIYFSAYFGAAFYLMANGIAWARRDVIISLLVAGALVSATAMFAVVIAVAVNFFISRYRWRLIVGAILVAAAVLSTLYYYFYTSKYFSLTLGFLFGGSSDFISILTAIVGRGGNRLLRALWGIDAFLNHPIFGIGFGADKAYTLTTPIPALARPFALPWSYAEGTPFINPFIEAAATMGIPGLVVLTATYLEGARRYFGLHRGRDRDAILVRSIFIGLLVMFLMLQIEGTFLRFYFWSIFGLALGAAARWGGRLHEPANLATPGA